MVYKVIVIWYGFFHLVLNHTYSDMYYSVFNVKKIQNFQNSFSYVL